MTPERAVTNRPHLSSGLSQDGKWAYVTLPYADEEPLGRHFRVYVCELGAAGSEKWQRLGGDGFSLHTPSVSPDSGFIAVLRDADEGTHAAIFDLRMPQGPYRVVADLPNATLAYKWLARPNELCCLGLDEEGTRRVWVWRNGSAIPLTPEGRPVVDYATWDKLFAYIYEENGEDVILVCDATGVVVQRIDGSRAKARLCFSPDGRFLAFVRGGAKKGDDEEIAVIDTNDPSAVPVLFASPDMGVVTSFDWRADNSLLVAVASETRGRLFSFGLTGEVKEQVSELRYLSAPSCAVVANRWIYLEQDSDVPQRMVLVESDGTTRVLTHFNLALSGGSRGETVSWISSDGMMIQGIWLTPEGDGPFRTIIWLHGGPKEHIGHTFSAYFQVLVSAGFAVFAPNYRGSSGRGASFARQAVSCLGELDVADIKTGLAMMMESERIHQHKFGFWGWHYGGTLALLLCAKEGIPAKAIIAGAPFVDWVGAFGALADPSPMEEYFSANWWQDRRPFDQLSPISYVADLQTPVLILQGQQDRLLPLSQSMLLYRALTALSVEVDLVYYVNEGHVLRAAPAVSDMLTRAVDWFERRLVGFDLLECAPST